MCAYSHFTLLAVFSSVEMLSAGANLSAENKEDFEAYKPGLQADTAVLTLQRRII